jgi:hypothetical protein
MRDAIEQAYINNQRRQQRIENLRSSFGSKPTGGSVLFDLLTLPSEMKLQNEQQRLQPQYDELQANRRSDLARAIGGDINPSNFTNEQLQALRMKQLEQSITPKKREIMKDAQGYQRYVDTGDRVFPDAKIDEVSKVPSKDGQFDLLFKDNKPVTDGLDKGLQWGVDKQGNRLAVPIATVPNEKAQVVKDQTLDLVNSILNNEDGLNSVYGAVDQFMPNLLSSTRRAQTDINQLKNILTAENLDLMSGVLSETDIKIIAGIAGGQLADTNTQEGVRQALQKLKVSLEGERPNKTTSLKDKYGLE